MKEFCKWMKKKGYGHIDYEHGEIIYYGIGTLDDGVEGFTKNHPKQMLIGYMIEYLFIKHNADLIEMVIWSVIEDIDKLYSDLEFTINSLDE